MTPGARNGVAADPIGPPPRLLIAATSHRSGSTLVQRYATAVTDTFVWGESGVFIEALWRASDGWPSTRGNERDYREIMADPPSIERRYTPNLAPPRDVLVEQFRRTVRGVYAELPEGYTGWGWKAVSYGRGEIEFVRELFPELRILVLVRDPWDVARSIRRKGWIDRRGYFRDMADAAEHWMLKTRDLLEIAERGEENVLLIRYEDLRQRLDELHRFLGVEVEAARSEEVLARRLGTQPTVSRFRLTDEDVAAVTRICGELATKLGYGPVAGVRGS